MKQSAPRIFFVTYGGGHVDIVSRLLAPLEQLQLPRPTVLALTTAPHGLKSTACNMRRCVDYITVEGYEAALDVGGALAESFRSPHSPVPWDETCAYYGVSMIDLTQEHGEDQAMRLYADLGRKAFLPVHFMAKVLEIEQPDIVVTTCHVRMERAATIAAKAAGIMTVRIEDLFGYSMLGAYPHGELGTLIAEDEQPDHVIVPNIATQNIMIENGFPSSRIHPLGQPVFSNWKNELDNASPLKELTVSGKPVVTYIATPVMSDLVKYSRDFIEIAKKQKELTFCIKLHPSTSLGHFLDELGEIPENIHVLSTEPIVDIIQSSAIVILQMSTVGVLCAIAKTKMIVWSTEDYQEILPYVSSGAASLVHNKLDLERNIEEFIARKNMGVFEQDLSIFEFPDQADLKIAEWLASPPPPASTTQEN